MKKIAVALGLSVAALVLAGCSSPQDKAFEAQEKVHEERLELVEKYQECLKDAGEDKMQAEACEQYLKSADALK